VRVPLVVLTGFLGSGKTTLINRLLARRGARDAPKNHRLAGASAEDARANGKLGLIVNELGAVDIDGALLAASGETRQINLPGGCVCCVMGDDLDRTLIELCDANPDLDAIVLETTGVAEPISIAWAVARAPVCERVRLAAVVALVDATMFRASRAVSGAVDAQVTYADALLVTKAELAGPAETAAVESAIRTLASRSVVRTATSDDHAAWLEELLRDPSLERPSLARQDLPHHAHVHDDTCRHLDNAAHGVDSVWVPVPGVVDLEELEDQLADLPGNYVRIKGILRAVDGRVGQSTALWIAVHRVGLRVSSEPIRPPDLEEGRMVALGPGVSAATLAECVARASS
jgi:G3E family GTPase